MLYALLVQSDERLPRCSRLTGWRSLTAGRKTGTPLLKKSCPVNNSILEIQVTVTAHLYISLFRGGDTWRGAGPVEAAAIALRLTLEEPDSRHSLAGTSLLPVTTGSRRQKAERSIRDHKDSSRHISSRTQLLKLQVVMQVCTRSTYLHRWWTLIQNSPNVVGGLIWAARSSIRRSQRQYTPPPPHLPIQIYSNIVTINTFFPVCLLKKSSFVFCSMFLHLISVSAACSLIWKS